MKILSVFNGMNCGRIALERQGISVSKYYSSEIDKYANQVTQENYPDTIQLGDIRNIKAKDLDKIDLFIGGSPCTGFSFIGKMLNFHDPQSKLFFEYVRLWNEIRTINPKAKFMLENVKMKKEHLRIISEYLGIFPVNINSNLVSGQNRSRWYWTNIKTKETGLFNELWSDIPQPKDKDILLKDILEVNVNPGYYLTIKEMKRGIKKHSPQIWKSGNRNGKVNFPTLIAGKAKTLVTLIIKGDRALNHILDEKGIRILTPYEYEILQNIPVNYTDHVSDTQRYKMLGNGWTVDIIAHIFSFLTP